MIEIYLFVNPLCNACLETEKDILNFIETENKKIQFRFIPLVNMKMINYVLKLYNTHINSVEKRNKLFEDTYSVALDYKAAQLQGKKKGRQLLLKLQEAITKKKIPYSKKLAEQFIIEVGGDLKMFQSDRQSEVVKESLNTDQKIAREMGVSTPPSAVVFNYTSEFDYGVLIEECYSANDVKQICECPTEQAIYDLQASSNKQTAHHQANLHLL